jgi:REase_MTES_1575/Protein of unknown function (DUF4011)/AAA domain/Protein of unknown function (DUF3320)
MMRTEGRGVRDDGHDRPSADREMLVRSAIGGWRDSLIKAAAASQLLDLKPGRAPMIRLVRPSAGDILSRLRSGGTYTFRSLPPASAWPPPAGEPAGPADGHGERAPGTPPLAADILDADAGPDDLASTLRTLMRRSNQDYLDRGLWVLYLAFGTLTWTGQDRARCTSPVLLVPVRLVATGPRQLPALEPTEDDPAVNPALVRKLSQNGITLPPMDEAEEVTLSGLLDTVRAAVAGRDGWQVGDEVVLSCFSFAGEAIYRDLLDHGDLAAAHPAVRALAAGAPGGPAAAGPGFAFDVIAEREIDTRAAPESTPVILDADASQRAAIAAALDGRSFVLDGPPGTGKSQTIANMIGALLHAGKTVLFVSEKAAALDVVSDRLASAGLDPYLLELHSDQAARQQVAVSLAKALDTVPVAPTPMPPADVDTARRRREQLSAYAEAMNRTRDPLGYSLHDILGVIATLRAVPAAPTTGRVPVADLTMETFGQIRQAAATLAGAWRPAAQGRSFVWRGVTERGPLDAPLYQAASALEALAGIARLNGTLAEVTGLARPSDAGALARLLDHLLTWPPGMPDEWLTAGTLDAVDAAVARLSTGFTEIAACEDRASRAAGAPWSAIPRLGLLPALDDEALAGLTPASADADGLAVEQITGLSQAFSAEAEMLERRQGTLSSLAGLLGLRTPATFGDAADLLLIAQLAEEPDRPERGWLSVPGSQQAREAGRTLYDAHHALARAEADASAYYTHEALYADVPGLAGRFDGEHHRLGKLSAEYRADRKTVASFTKEGVTRETACQQLPLAVAWQRAAQALASAEAACAPLLGRYYTGSTTDFDRLGHALNRAAAALQRAHGQDLRKAASFIAADARPDPAITGVAAETRQDLAAWQATLAAPPAAAARPELLDGSITDAIGWLRAHLAPLYAAAAFTHAVSEVVGQPLTLGQARHLVALREAADAAHQRLAASEAALREVCGGLYAGDQTDLMALRGALDWARRLRTMITGGAGPLTPAHLKAAESAVPTPRLPAAADAWRQAKHAVVAAFSPDRQAELAAELDDYGAAADLIEVMFDDTSGRDEWHTYQAARASLAAYGLDVAIDFCIAEHVEPAQVPRVIERALLQEWAEHYLRTDPALATVGAADRDALVAEYQELDRALTAAAAGDVIRACNARRPRSDIGESAIIHREAEKKRKHLPVPVLIERARHVAQAIKPCFTMSPLAVSQYLPADMRFDVVIVDEASQVGPAAAVSCIYRGGALILAGDVKQLPPTGSASGGAPDDGDQRPAGHVDAPDCESVLDLAQESGAYQSLTLRWHYRSRHEALIAFSNDAFYSGRLVTFPSRHRDGPDVGVELFWVEGTYWRGTSRDNPREAALVAERVIHHFDTRPGLSLGVVTLTDAQADAIESAVGRARQYRPDLDRFFTNDRLRGFFVKSAEAVQGDERDVLIFSVGYGPDETGKITMNFGPLSRPGGWRRLNVAITRARYRNEIVSSVRAADIPESVTSEGVRLLRRYLDYAGRGLPTPGAGGDDESPFVESVINVVRSWGYGLTPQVGTTGYRIDIGIHYPSHPGVYALGVECDGHQYHSCRAARDRDRLRAQVLRDNGWNLHRIWSAAWYRDREGEERRLQAAIEHAMAASPHALAHGATRPKPAARPIIQTETPGRPATRTEAADRAASQTETADRPATRTETPDRAPSQTETPGRPATRTETPDRAASQTETADRPITRTEAADRAASQTETADRPITRTETADRPVGQTGAAAPPVPLPGAAARPGPQTEAASADAVPSWAVPYVTATVPPLPPWVDPADPGSQFMMTDGVRAVVGTEAPVHVSIVHERLRDAWDTEAAGTRIRDNIDAAIRLADVVRDGEFVTLAGAPRPAVRTPVPACERTIEQVHDRELALALVNLVRDAAGISRSELTTRVAHLYGWTGHEPDITGRMAAIISELRRNGTLAGDQHGVPAAPGREQGTVGAGGTMAGRTPSWHAEGWDRARP